MKIFSISFLTLIFFAIWIASCRQSTSNLVEPPSQTVSAMDIALKLKQWSVKQQKPFVIFTKGDTTSGELTYQYDIVTNLGLDSQKVGYLVYYDSLFIGNSYSINIVWRNYQQSLMSILDLIDLSFTEKQMTEFLSHYSLQLRMMHYDSLTYQLNKKLVRWAYYHNPPQRIRSGFYPFVKEGANFGGYSRPLFTYEGVQSLQFFTRKVSADTLKNIINVLTIADTTLTAEQLKKLMSPVAVIELHTTTWGWE